MNVVHSINNEKGTSAGAFVDGGPGTDVNKDMNVPHSKPYPKTRNQYYITCNEEPRSFKIK